MPTEKKSTKLGPTVTIPVAVNEVKVDALVDTAGCPITIFLLKFAMVILSQEDNQFKSITEWKVAMRERLKPPDFVLTGYSGEQLNVLAQLKVTINQGEYTVTAIVLFQKDAPSPLLLGTDILSSLGFSFIFEKIGEISSNTDALEKHNAKGDTEMRDSVTQTDDIRI